MQETEEALSALETPSNAAKLNVVVVERNKDDDEEEFAKPNEPKDDMNDEYYKQRMTTNDDDDDDDDDDDELSSTVTSGPTKVEMLMRVLESRMSCDHLHLAENPAVLLLLQQHESDAFDILFSDVVVKYNRKGKSQSRVILITSSSIYNLIPGQFKNCRRRIPIEKISSLTLSERSDDFVAHVRDEYDYLFRSVRRGEIVRIIAHAYQALTNAELEAEISGSPNLMSTMVMKASMDKRASALGTTVDVERNLTGGLALTKRIRSLVSKKKVRYQNEDFDLDLTYITDRLIAMGFPSEDIEGIYRNPMSEVLRLLETKHLDQYKVYNLCSERTYDPSKFHRRVALYPFEDHSVPTIEMILEFCRNVSDWLRKPGHVAAIHCKAGKGRTGLMLSCYMLFSQMFTTAEQALEYFGRKRTHNGKGVTIPSQRRFVSYFASFLRTYYGPDKPFSFNGVPLVLTNVHLSTIPHFDADGGCDPYFKILGSNDLKLYDSRKVGKTVHSRQNLNSIDLPCAARCRGRIKILFYDQDQYSFDQPMFHFWLHTSFIGHNYVILTKMELDKACKDTGHKRFDENFTVELFFRPDDIATVQVPVKSALLASRSSDFVDSDSKTLRDNVDRLRQRLSEVESLYQETMNQNSLLSLQVAELRDENDQLQQDNATLRSDKCRM